MKRRTMTKKRLQTTYNEQETTWNDSSKQEMTSLEHCFMEKYGEDRAQALIYCILYSLQGREFEEINTSEAKVNHVNQVL